MKKKASSILAENSIFIILNILFFSILAIFIFMKSNDSALMEEAYAKKIALILDAAKPGMNVTIDMQEALKRVDKEYAGKIVSIEGNLVTVKFSSKGGYSYSFFNNIHTEPLYFYPGEVKEYSFLVKEGGFS